MPLPEFNDKGVLPPGIYECSPYSLDAYITVAPNGNNFVEFFQYVGIKEGMKRDMSSKEKKGIIKVII